MFASSALGKLKLWQTFLILSLMGLMLASIPTYLYTREAGKALDAYSSEQLGLPTVTSALKAIQLTQQHRGLSALALANAAGADDKRADKQKEVEAAYTALDGHVKASGNDTIQTAWTSVRVDWDSLRAGVSGKTLSVPESYASHVKLLAKLLRINEALGDHYALSLDPDKDSYQLIQAMYFQLPALTEELGQLRAKGGGLLAKKEAAPADRMAVQAIIARVNDRMAQTANAFGKAAAENPAIATRLGPLMAAATTQANKFTDLATREIVLAETLALDGPEYVSFATSVIDAQFTLNNAARADLEAMFITKIGAFHKTRWIMLGSMFGLVVLAGYFALAITRSVTVPLNNAVAVAQSVASGNLVNEFQIGGDNEVGQMLRALKTMNDSLRSIVGDVRESIENISAATRDIAHGNADVSSRL